MDDDFMARLEGLRVDFGKPMPLSSAYRCPPFNSMISSTGPAGPHTTGRAVDVTIHGSDALRLIELALQRGFTGIGISQKGKRRSRFIHLDDLTPPNHTPRPWIWSY